MSILSTYPYYGTGVNFSPSYIDGLIKHKSLIGCIEIKPEHYFSENMEDSTAELHTLAEEFPMIAHGLQLSIGTANGPNERYIADMKRFLQCTPPLAWMGEHMGFCVAGDQSISHFATIPYTEETLENVCRNITASRRELSAPLVFENIPWDFAWPDSTMQEATFFAELVKRTCIGTLLDITNLYANSINFGWNLSDYLSEYPVGHIVQLHFNGGILLEDGRYLDNHSEPTPPEVWDIFREVLERGAPVRAAILERDDHATLDAMADDLAKAQQFMEKYGRWH